MANQYAGEMMRFILWCLNAICHAILHNIYTKAWMNKSFAHTYIFIYFLFMNMD